jgi:hypothetical protein
MSQLMQTPCKQLIFLSGKLIQEHKAGSKTFPTPNDIGLYTETEDFHSLQSEDCQTSQLAATISVSEIGISLMS